MNKNQDISERGTVESKTQPHTTGAGKRSLRKKHTEVVVKRERLFSLLQEENIRERLTSRDATNASDTPSAGLFRLYGSDPLPEIKPMEAENDNPTSLGVITHS